MRFARTHVLVFFLMAVSPSFAQQTSTTVQRDPQAVAILQRSFAAMGANSLPTAVDVAAAFAVTKVRFLINMLRHFELRKEKGKRDCQGNYFTTTFPVMWVWTPQ